MTEELRRQLTHWAFRGNARTPIPYRLCSRRNWMWPERTLRSAQEIIAFWLEQEQRAREAGFTSIRISGDGTNLVSADDWKSGLDYERLADAAFKGRSITALSTYSLATGSPARLAEILSGHHCGRVRRSGAWDEIRTGAGVSTAIEFLQAVS